MRKASKAKVANDEDYYLAILERLVELQEQTLSAIQELSAKFTYSGYTYYPTTTTVPNTGNITYTMPSTWPPTIFNLPKNAIITRVSYNGDLSNIAAEVSEEPCF